MPEKAKQELAQSDDGRTIYPEGFPRKSGTNWVDPGVYRHFKGGLYYVLGTALSADPAGALNVVYTQGGIMYTRDLDDFTAYVTEGVRRFEPAAGAKTAESGK